MRTTALLAVAAVLALAALALLQHGTRQQTLLAGALLVLVGLPLLLLARRQLGDAFSVAPQAKRLVTSGLYARIPHPLYVFLDLALLGLVLLLQRAWLLVPWAGLVCVQAWQARREDRVLEQAFGDAYREYRRHTWW